ncbi:MAG: hypothetical protein ACYTGB_15140 [Planctomycetota bacterium]
MIRRIRELMRTPMARPPGRRGLMRFAPEMAAGVTYLAAASAVVLAAGSGYPRDLDVALIAGLAIGGFLTFAAAINSASRALARERDRGTLEATLLASTDHDALVRGRLWCVTKPWLRFFLYILPLYLALASSDLLEASWNDREAVIISLLSAFSSRFNLLFLLLRNRVDLEWDHVHLWGVFIVLVRWLNHISVFLFASAAAYWISSRARSAATALVLSCVAVPAALASFLGLHELFISAAIFDLIDWDDWMVWIYGALTAICVAARLLVTGYLLRRTTRDLVASGP